VEAGAAARRLQQALGAGAGGAAREELRQAVVNTLERKLFDMPSFKIYRGVAGLYELRAARVPRQGQRDFLLAPGDAGDLSLKV
jgi:hypothetical protein